MSPEIYSHDEPGRQNVQQSVGCRRVISILLWLAVSTGLMVSIFSIIEEMCLATACRDTASFTIFGANLGWFGIAYFSLILILLWLRNSFCRLEWALYAMVFSGIGTELRLLWIQKYVIGSWCPLCVTISCALLVAAMLLVIEKVQGAGSGEGGGQSLIGWLAFMVAMIATGLAIAMVGVQALT